MLPPHFDLSKLRHPARFSVRHIQEIAKIIHEFGLRGSTTIDPCAGTGERIVTLNHDPHNCDLKLTLVEIGEHWSRLTPEEKNVRAYNLDSTFLPFKSETFDLVITSPVYGNRMSDCHFPSDDDTSKRNTYTHCTMEYNGSVLTSRNAGRHQFGEKYKQIQMHIWLEMLRLLKPGGFFLLNTKSFWRKDQLVSVTDWHTQFLVCLGFDVVHQRTMAADGLREGENHEVREEVEDFTLLRRGQLP